MHNCTDYNYFDTLQNPSKMKKAQHEIDSVLGQDVPTYELIKKLE